MRRAFFAAFLALPLPATAIQNETANNAAEFLKIGAGARALGFGEAYGPIAEGPEALYWNPAGLAQLRRPEAHYTRGEFLRFFHHDYAAYAHPGFFGGTLGASIARLSQQSLPVVDNANQEIGRFSPDSFAFAVGYGRALTLSDFKSGERDYFREAWFVPGANRPMRGDRDLWIGTLMVGGALKVIHERFYHRSGSAFALDAGALFRPEDAPQWSLSMAVRHIGGQIHYGVGGGQNLPAELDFGLAHDKRGWKSRLLPTVEAAIPYHGNPYAKLGLEYSWPATDAVTVSVRGGFKSQAVYDLGPLAGVAIGAGARWRRLSADLGFQPVAELGQVYHLSLAWRF